VAHSGGVILLSKLCPDLYVESLHYIDLSRLKDMGILGIVFDIDNTVTIWGSKEVSPMTFKLLEDAKASGFRVCLLSNNRKARIDDISRMLDIPSAKGFKPFGSAFRSALSLLGTSPQETAIIGDQIFTDILGGNRAGLFTILVQPMSTHEFITTRFVRRLERVVLRRLVCSGMLKSKDHIPAK
jgi:HAD superfamily phosphatase (TIGR01668 family)